MGRIVTMQIGKAIRLLRERRGMFQAELARRVGISKQRLYKIESGRSQPPPDVFSRIAEHLAVTMEEIIELAERRHDLEVEELGGVQVKNFVPVPVYGEVPAGDSGLADEAIIDVRHIDPHMVRWIPGDAAKNSFWLRVRGDSMHEQTDDGSSLTDDDLILVCRDVPCSDGEVGVVRLPEGGAAVKRIYRRGDRLLLVSSNPAYRPVEVDEAHFVGAVMARWTPPEKFRRHTRRPPGPPD
jgi:SOS-response transcriptional repressor LexA